LFFSISYFTESLQFKKQTSFSNRSESQFRYLMESLFLSEFSLKLSLRYKYGPVALEIIILNMIKRLLLFALGSSLVLGGDERNQKRVICPYGSFFQDSDQSCNCGSQKTYDSANNRCVAKGVSNLLSLASNANSNSRSASLSMLGSVLPRQSNGIGIGISGAALAQAGQGAGAGMAIAVAGSVNAVPGGSALAFNGRSSFENIRAGLGSSPAQTFFAQATDPGALSLANPGGSATNIADAFRSLSPQPVPLVPIAVANQNVSPDASQVANPSPAPSAPQAISDPNAVPVVVNAGILQPVATQEAASASAPAPVANSSETAAVQTTPIVQAAAPAPTPTPTAAPIQAPADSQPAAVSAAPIAVATSAAPIAAVQSTATVVTQAAQQPTPTPAPSAIAVAVPASQVPIGSIFPTTPTTAVNSTSVSVTNSVPGLSQSSISKSGSSVGGNTLRDSIQAEFQNTFGSSRPSTTNTVIKSGLSGTTIRNVQVNPNNSSVSKTTISNQPTAGLPNKVSASSSMSSIRSRMFGRY
jgi:hypothetical protein